ncbi:MAG: hypothetical protein RLZZ243_669 [Bacteroidota bacterium]
MFWTREKTKSMFFTKKGPSIFQSFMNERVYEWVKSEKTPHDLFKHASIQE